MVDDVDPTRGALQSARMVAPALLAFDLLAATGLIH